MKAVYNSAEISLYFQVDPSFDGILRGCAHDECEGCVLSGKLIMVVHRLTKIKSLETKFVGEINVNFRTTNTMGIPTNDGIESRILCHKYKIHFNEEMIHNNSSEIIKSTVIQPGTYKFPFKFNVSGSLPHSFRGKHGSIQYNLEAYAVRSLLSSDIHISHPIVLRRCLMNSVDPVAPASQTVRGYRRSDILDYSATAPSIVYCEGGLLTVNFNLRLLDPKKYSIAIVTCGLQERILYRTTGLRSLTNEKKRIEEISYPLGCSTFYPSDQDQVDSTGAHNFNAIFRLCPRMHTDNRSSLMVVQHRLFIRISIEEKEDKKVKSHKRQRSVDSISSTGSSSGAARVLSYLSLKKHDVMPKPIPIPYTNSSRPSLLSQSMSSEESAHSHPTANIDSILQDFEANSSTSSVNIIDNMETLQISASPDNSCGDLSTSQTNSSKLSQPRKSSTSSLKNLIECYLKIPIVVTSREEYREGEVPAIPDYDTAVDSPPNYRLAIRSLPPVPNYLTATIH